MDPKKNDAISEKYRAVGNKLYKNNYLFLALIAYNKSICYANSKETLALAYANRSAVYLEVGKYDECLENIQFARESYPKDKLEKLIEREEKCKKVKQENAGKPNDIPDKFFRLSYPANAQNPNIIDGVEFRNGKLFTKRELIPGDIVMIKQRTNLFSAQAGYVNRCYSCFKVNSMNLIPSLQSAEHMFCSEKCRNKHWNDNVYNRLRVVSMCCPECKEENSGKQHDPCPIYDENAAKYKSNASLENPLSNPLVGNLTFFLFDGNMEVYFASHLIKAGEYLFCSFITKMSVESGLWTLDEEKKRKCYCFHCKLKVPACDPKLALIRPDELLTTKQLVEKLTANMKRLGKISRYRSKAEEIQNLVDSNEKCMDLLAIRKTYFSEGLYCTCRTCASSVKV